MIFLKEQEVSDGLFQIPKASQGDSGLSGFQDPLNVQLPNTLSCTKQSYEDIQMLQSFVEHRGLVWAEVLNPWDQPHGLRWEEPDSLSSLCHLDFHSGEHT